MNNAAVTFLCAAKASGVDFSETLMLGRQGFYPDREVLRRGLDALRITAPNNLLGRPVRTQRSQKRPFKMKSSGRSSE